MSFLEKIFKKQDKPRILRCRECGTILPEHTDWCVKREQARG